MQSLQLAENESAVAAGVNLMLLGGTTAAICQLQALSPDGRCKTLDATADGYGRGEGVAVLVLQNPTAGNSAHAVILGSAVNQVCIRASEDMNCLSVVRGVGCVCRNHPPSLHSGASCVGRRLGCSLREFAHWIVGRSLQWLDGAKWAQPDGAGALGIGCFSRISRAAAENFCPRHRDSAGRSDRSRSDWTRHCRCDVGSSVTKLHRPFCGVPLMTKQRPGTEFHVAKLKIFRMKA